MSSSFRRFPNDTRDFCLLLLRHHCFRRLSRLSFSYRLLLFSPFASLFKVSSGAKFVKFSTKEGN